MAPALGSMLIRFYGSLQPRSQLGSMFHRVDALSELKLVS